MSAVATLPTIKAPPMPTRPNHAAAWAPTIVAVLCFGLGLYWIGTPSGRIWGRTVEAPDRLDKMETYQTKLSERLANLETEMRVLKGDVASGSRQTLDAIGRLGSDIQGMRATLEGTKDDGKNNAQQLLALKERVANVIELLDQTRFRLDTEKPSKTP